MKIVKSNMLAVSWHCGIVQWRWCNFVLKLHFPWVVQRSGLYSAILWTPLKRGFSYPHRHRAIRTLLITHSDCNYFTACNSYKSCSYCSFIQQFRRLHFPSPCWLAFVTIDRWALQIAPTTFDSFQHFVSHIRGTELKQSCLKQTWNKIVLFQL